MHPSGFGLLETALRRAVRGLYDRVLLLLGSTCAGSASCGLRCGISADRRGSSRGTGGTGLLLPAEPRSVNLFSPGMEWRKDIVIVRI